MKSNDRLYPLGNADDHREQDGIPFHDDAAGSQRDILAIDGLGSIVSQRIVKHDLNPCDGHLVDTAADSHIKRTQIVPRRQTKAFLCQHNGTEVP